MNSLTSYSHVPELDISIASEGDKAGLIELINHSFAYQDVAKGDVRIDSNNLTKKMRKSDFYVWKDSSAIVACCYVEPLDDRVHFGLLCVADSLRGSGLAPSIISSIEEYARGRGDKIVELDYMSLSPWLKKYYERMGYKETGEAEDIGWCSLVRMNKAV